MNDNGGGLKNSTLHAALANPSTLSHILLFPGANPRWHPDKIIFVKSNLDLLPLSSRQPNESVTSPTGERTESAPSQGTIGEPQPEAYLLADHDSIAVFEQLNRAVGFKLIGYHEIIKLEVLEP